MSLLKKIEKLGSHLVRFIGEREEYGVKEESPTLRELKKFFESYPFSSLLPYRNYDSRTRLFHNEEGMGFVIEASPLVGCSEEMQREISGLFSAILPEGGSIQFLLWADPQIGGVLGPWEQIRKDQGSRSQDSRAYGSLFEKIASKRKEFFEENVFEKDFLTPLRNFRCIISYSQKQETMTPLEETNLLSLREQILTLLRTLGLPAKLMDPEGLINFLDGILNFNEGTSAHGTRPQEINLEGTSASGLKWNPYDSINEQIPSSDYAYQIEKDQILLGEDYAIRAYSPRREPDEWSLYSMNELLGDSLRDLMRVKTPFLIHYGVHIPNQEKTKTRIQSREGWVEAQARSKIGKRIPILVSQSRELDFIRHHLSKGERFVQASFSVFLFGKRQEIEAYEQVLLTLFRSKRWQISRERYIHLQLFLSMLPMNWGEGFWEDLKFHGRLKTTISTESSNLLPLQGEWKGTESPGMLLVGRRGQVFTWSPFDNKAGNYNVSVVGRSGSGKSVFMQELMVSTLGQGGQVFVLDVGRSFEKTVKLLGGTYIEFTPETKISINPFTTIPQDNPQETSDALSMLKPILSLMAAPKEGTSDLENAYLEKALREVWDQKKELATITDISDFLLKEIDSIAKTLGQKLFPYTKMGTYARFFNSPATVDLSSKLVVVELEELKERKDLQSVIVQMVILQITNKLYLGDRKTPSHLVLDEAWDMLRGKGSGEFIETAARRLRKYKGSLVVGTQSINDFYATPGAQAAFDNSDWVCLLSQKKESIEQLKKTNRISLDPTMEMMLGSVQTREGHYAEVMIYGLHGYAISRLLLDPYSLVLYSTKPEEFAAVQDLVLKGLHMEEAVEKVAGRRR